MRREAGFLPGGVLALILLFPQFGSGQTAPPPKPKWGWHWESWSEVDPLRPEALSPCEGKACHGFMEVNTCTISCENGRAPRRHRPNPR